MDILTGLSSGSSQCGSQQLLTLWRALEEEFHGCRQQGQLHLILLVSKALSTGLQQIRRILQWTVATVLALDRALSISTRASAFRQTSVHVSGSCNQMRSLQATLSARKLVNKHWHRKLCRCTATTAR